MRQYKYVVPWPPSINSLYFQGKSHGQKFLSKKGKEYKQSMKYLLASDDMDPITYPIRIRIELFPPNKAVRDLDNYIKPILDGLKFVEIIEDDSLINKLVVIKNAPNPKYNKGIVLVKIKEDATEKRDLPLMIDKYLTECNIDKEDLEQLFINRTKAYNKREGV